MKRLIGILFLIVGLNVSAQKITKPTEGKAAVYFVRSSDYGFLINFKYFDGEKYLGKYSKGYYMAYECDPGKHLFWVKAENMDFVEADLEANKVYILDAEPQMGMIKSAVRWKPYDNDVTHYKNEKKFNNRRDAIMNAIMSSEKYTLTEAEASEADVADLIKRGNEKYQKQKGEGTVFTTLPPEMFYQ